VAATTCLFSQNLVKVESEPYSYQTFQRIPLLLSAEACVRCKEENKSKGKKGSIWQGAFYTQGWCIVNISVK